LRGCGYEKLCNDGESPVSSKRDYALATQWLCQRGLSMGFFQWFDSPRHTLGTVVSGRVAQ
jgi:hypothetical protein